jgi:hypothetical protein
MIELNRRALALLIGLSLPIGIVVVGLWALAKSVGL